MQRIWHFLKVKSREGKGIWQAKMKYNENNCLDRKLQKDTGSRIIKK
jgi:hypothetical protein